MTNQEQKKTTQLEKFILMLRGQKTRSEAHQLILLLTDNPARTKEENKQLDVLLKAERAKVSAKKAALAATKLLSAKGDDERKARNHRLILQGILVDLAGLEGRSRGEILGLLLAGATTTDTQKWEAWASKGNAMLAEKESGNK